MHEGWETFDHTADLGLEVRAATPERLYALAAEAVLAQVAECPTVAPTLGAAVEASGADAADLLVEWLNRALLAGELANAVWTHVEVQAWSPTRLAAALRGVPRERSVVTFLREVKAVSHHGLELELAPGHCRCRVVLDL